MQPGFEWIGTVEVAVGPPLGVGSVPGGERRIIPILVLPGGADFQLIVNPRLAELDARYTLETDAGDLIYVHNRALRVAEPNDTARLIRGEPVDPARIYFRCSPSFETASAALGWISESPWPEPRPPDHTHHTHHTPRKHSAAPRNNPFT